MPKNAENLKVVIVDDQISLSENQPSDIKILMRRLGQCGIKPENIFLVKVSVEDFSDTRLEREEVMRGIAGKIERVNPDLVFMDHDMFDINSIPVTGPTIVAHLNKSFRKKSAVVGWSSNAQNADYPEVGQAFNKVGVEEIFRKDISSKAINALLCQVVFTKEENEKVLVEHYQLLRF
ncbi:MAG: hypothetical protein A2103_02390 [Gammaproteobacteria bacterium GWF2_41_13]|nr:MAG: hypothetical protein A2103_02390 [Gammaproteobacteria bacterium GWF2_41_13]